MFRVFNCHALPRWASHPLVVALLFAGLTAVIGSLHLTRGLYIDEYTTWRVINLPSHEALVHDRLYHGHLPGYFAALRFWTLFFGDSESAMRLPSLLLVAASGGLMWLLAREFLTTRAAVLASLFFSCHQLTLWTGQTARPYAPMLFFLLLAAVGSCRYAKGGRGAWLAVVGLGSVGAMLVQPLALTVLVALAAAAVFGFRRSARRSVILCGVIVAAILAVQPLYGQLVREQSNFAAERFRFPLKRLGDGLARVFLGDFTLVMRNDLLEIMSQVALVGCLALAAWGLRGKRAGLYNARWLIGCWLLFPCTMLLSMAALGSKSVLSHPRYYVAILPPLALVFGGAVMALERLATRHGNWLRWAPTLIFVPMVAYSGGWMVEDGDGPHQVAEMLEGAAPERIVGDTMPFRYEWRDRNVELLETRNYEEVLAYLAATADGPDPGAVWLAVYENKENPFSAIEEEAPERWTINRRLRALDARLLELLPMEGAYDGSEFTSSTRQDDPSN
ncbi:hypothetical protein GC173_18100 [bacterium]|nr:hypothetical protein [bacterium]